MNHDGTGLTIVAGSYGVPGYVNAVGTAARLGQCKGLAIDGSYIYFADQSSVTLRRIALSDYTVDFLAGSYGVLGTTDGVGAAASFTMINSMAVEGGDLYVVEGTKHCIRKVITSGGSIGTVSTIAGTCGTSGSNDAVGTSATFYSPTRMTSVNGNLYITESGNNKIRKVELATNTVSTFAGAGGACDYANGVGTAAKFCSLNGAITNDGSQFLYVWDSHNAFIRKIRLSDATVTTFLGVQYSSRDDAPGSLTGMSFYLPELLYVQGKGLLMPNYWAINVKIIK